MKLRWLIPLAVLFSPLSHVMQGQVSARVATVVISPNEVTILHLRPEFESSIRMPEEVTSVILGSPGTFKAEHNEGEPEYVYVKPVTKEPAQSNLLVATKSGAHVTLELISDGNAASTGQPVDFLLEYLRRRDEGCDEVGGRCTLPPPMAARARTCLLQRSAGVRTPPHHPLG